MRCNKNLPTMSNKLGVLLKMDPEMSGSEIKWERPIIKSGMINMTLKVRTEAKTKRRMKASDKFYNKISITVEGTRESPCGQKMYPVPKIRGKVCIGGLNGLGQNHWERGKKGMSTQLCQLVEGKISMVSTGDDKVKRRVAEKSSTLLTESNQK